MKNKLLKLFKIILILIFIGVSLYIYYGFYFIDDTVYNLHPATPYLLKGIRLFFPILVIGLLLLYAGLYLKKVQKSSVVLLFFTIFFLMLLFYPAADHFYRDSLNIDNLNSFLQINPPSVNDFDSTKYNIFCLGGSTTEFKDENGREWPGLVQEKLTEDPELKDIRLFNQGKQWYSTQHILINYMLNLKQYKPDAIIVMENINDLLHNADFSWLSNGTYRNDYGNFLGPLTRIMKYGSFAEFSVKTLKGLWYAKKPSVITSDKFPGIKAFERNLKTLIYLANEDSTTVILMTQPNLYKDSMSVEETFSLEMLNTEAIGNGVKWSYKTAKNGFVQYNNKIRELAAANENVYLIDLENIVPKNSEYFYDDVHYKVKTYDLISEYISTEIKAILKKANKINKF